MSQESNLFGSKVVHVRRIIGVLAIVHAPGQPSILPQLPGECFLGYATQCRTGDIQGLEVIYPICTEFRIQVEKNETKT